MNPVVEWVNTQHTVSKWRLFTPAAVELSLGIPEAEGLKALRTMAAAGLLRIEVHLICNEGHTAWAGPADSVPGYLDCRVCDFPSDDPDDYAVTEQFVWVEPEPVGDCATCEGTDGPGTGNPWPCALHPKSKPSKVVLAGEVALDKRLDIAEKKLPKPDACPHGVWPTTNCRICWA